MRAVEGLNTNLEISDALRALTLDEDRRLLLKPWKHAEGLHRPEIYWAHAQRVKDWVKVC